MSARPFTSLKAPWPLLTSLLLLVLLPLPALATDAERQRGEYLTRVAGCVACHSEHHDAADSLSGGAAIDTPFGRFFPPNLTPDRDTGIGNWSDDDFLRAMQQGIAPDGHRYVPVFPYTSYSRMRRDDVLAIKRYLEAQPAVRQINKAHEPRGLGRFEALLPFWQWLNLKPEWSAVTEAASADVQAGAYLVEAVAHCGECHTGRDLVGATRHRLWLRGAQLPSGHRASNLTPHPDGLAAWDPAELATYLQTGRSELGVKARHEMREVVDHSSRYLTDADRAAIVAYLFALPAQSDAPNCATHGPRRRCTLP